MSETIGVQDPLIEFGIPLDDFEYRESPSTPQGNRISPSEFENLSQIYQIYKESADKFTFLTDLLHVNDHIEKEAVLKSAKWSIYGTQVHNLTYFHQIFERAKNLNRVPVLSDFRTTFPFRDNDYYLGLERILKKSDLDTINPSQSFWNEWRMNGQDFAPKKRKCSILQPHEVQKIWEENSVSLKDINTFFSNTSKIDENKLTPQNTMLLNEVPTITNIYFEKRNLQVPSIIDEICISKDFPNKPIHIIDYKTGKQFKIPEEKEKVQIFLMMTGVIVNILDKVNSIKFNYNDRDVTHSNFEFPSFKKRSLRNPLIGGIYSEQLLDYSELYNNSFIFSYVNPLTQQSINLSAKDMGFGTREGVRDMLMYLNDINTFYSSYKDILKKKLKSYKSPYTLPVFPIKGFDKNISCSKVIQSALI